MNMELRTLGYFVKVAETGTISAAAAASHVTQPAVSRQLRQLEVELGFDLFERSPGRVRLNAAGQHFLPFALDILRRVDVAGAVASSLASGRLERLSIAAPATTLTDLIAPFLATFQSDDPMPTVFECGAREARNALRNGADLAIVTEPPAPSLAYRPIAVLPVWAYVSDDHRWSHRKTLALTELACEVLLVLPRTFKPRQILDLALEHAGLDASQVVECSNSQVALALASAGRGIAVVSDDPRFDLRPIGISTASGILAIELFAVWEPHHHASTVVSDIARRLSTFCAVRYGMGTPLP